MTRSHALTLAAVLAAYCGLAVAVPPADDELYYWCWSRQLQLSYYDHPPMTAYMIRASTEVFGDNLFAIRFPACLATTIVLGVVVYLTRSWKVLVWVGLCPLFSIGAVLITPDTPLLLFWALYLVWLVAVHRRLEPDATGRPGRVPVWHWAVGGVLLGCGVLGKYTAGLAGIAGFLSFVLAGGWRRWLAGYVLHGLIAVAVASPILVYNVRNDFAPLLYQWGHAMGSHGPGVKPFAEFVGVQLLLFGTLPLLLLPWVAVNFRRLSTDPVLRVCACLYGFPFAFFLFKATRGPLEGNWALASYIAAWPLAAAWYESVRGRWAERWALPASFALPALVTLTVAAHLIHPLPIVSPTADRITRQTVKQQVADDLRAAIEARGERLPVYVETYQMASLLRFHGVDARQIDGASRPSHFTQTHDRVSDAPRAYVVWEHFPNQAQVNGCRLIERIAALPIMVRGELKAYYTLSLYTKPDPPAPPGGGTVP